jgi:hypothetical protein
VDRNVPEQKPRDAIVNSVSMTSSLSSIVSTEDYYSKAKPYLPSELQYNSKKNRKSLSVQSKLFEKTSTRQNSTNRTMNRSSAADVSLTGEYPLSPMSTTTTSPDIIYDALRVGSNSYSHLDDCMTPIRYNLSDVLRGSASDATSFFHDVNSPRTELSPDKKQSFSNLNSAPKSHSKSSKKNSSANGSKSSQLYHVPLMSSPGTSLIDNDNDDDNDLASFSSNIRDISSHSILQLCTEDLMCDQPDIVHAALKRLYDLCCCPQHDQKTDIPKVGTKAPKSNASTASTTSTVALNRIRFIKAGGHALIVGVMKKYSDHTNIQAAACKLIHNLILSDEQHQHPSVKKRTDNHTTTKNGNTCAFNELFSAVYGMDCVVAALTRFRSSTTTVRTAKTEPVRSQNVAHADMSCTPQENDVHNLACGALVAIVCSSFKMIDRLIQHDARNISCFFNAMHAPINQNVVGVNRVLHYILKHHPTYFNDVVIAGGMEEIIHEMKHHADIMEVQYCGCSVLSILAKNNSRAEMPALSKHGRTSNNNKGSIVEYIVNQIDGAHWIAAAMKMFPKNEDVQGKAVMALFYLTTSKSKSTTNVNAIQTSIKKAGGLSAIGIALENFPTNQTIQVYGCTAIRRLLETSPRVPPPTE